MRGRELRGFIAAWVMVAGTTWAQAPRTPESEALPTEIAPPRPDPDPPLAPAMLEGSVDPARYILGPGDRLLLTLWGLHDVQTEVLVNAEGALFVPRVGIFRAGGQTLATVRAAVEERLRAVYPTLHGGLTLVRPRSFVVHVAGAVARPGAYSATPLTHVSAVLERAGGVTARGSLRRVQVRREATAPSSSSTSANDRAGSPDDSAVIADLLRATSMGDRKTDPTVLDGDLVFVPLRDLEVEITGAVRRPGRYELVAGRDVAEALELAGGVTAEAATGLPLRLRQRGEADTWSSRSLPLTAAAGTSLHDGDAVQVPALADLRRVVIVEGAVMGQKGAASDPQRSPQVVDRRVDAALSAPREISVTLPFVDGDRVSDLLVKVGGLAPFADGQEAFVLRPAERGGVRRRIAVDLSAIAALTAPDLAVKAGDTLVVPSRRESILVSGAVQRPGLYQYSPELRPTDYITLAGGTTRTGSASSARVLARGGGSRSIGRVQAIEPGDAITVPERQMTTAEWIEITLIVSNLAVATTALVLSQVPH